MRVLAVNPTGQSSGAETVLVRALTAALDRGWQVTVACPPGPLTDRLAAAAITTTPIPDLKRPGGSLPVAAARMLVASLTAAGRLTRLSRDADLVIVNGTMALPAVRLARLRAPAVWLVHDVIVHPGRLRLVRLAAGALGGAIAFAEPAAHALAGVDLKTELLDLGTPWPIEPAPDHVRPPFVVGCAGALTPWKGQDVLLEAVAGMDRTDVVVEIAGAPFPKDTSYAEQLHRRAEQPDLRGRVRFLGAVADLPARMRTWSVAVSSSVLPECSPLVLLEAMSLGVPSVATDHGGPKYLLGDAGVTVAPGDPGAMAKGISLLLDDAGRWQRCHRAGPAQVAAHHALDDQNARLLDALAALAAA
jgi:glycosyltransferase involved in cell wall biosynthesis